MGREYFRDLFRLRIADCRAGGRSRLEATYRMWRRVRAELAAGAARIADLAIGGAELRALGIPPGPRFGEILRELLERVTDEPSLNERETLMGMIAQRVSPVEE